MLDKTTPQRYSSLGKDKLRQVLFTQVQAGVDFMAMEWDFPPFEMFPNDLDLHFLTCLRDPLGRAVSNFRMDKINGWFDRNGSFEDFCDQSSYFRAHNYYCRKICNLMSGEIQFDHVNYSLNVLHKFHNLIVMGRDDLAVSLRKSGIHKSPSHMVNDFLHAPLRHKFDSSELLVSDKERYWFVLNNSADNLIYSDFFNCF